VHPRLKTNYQTLLTRCVEESVKEMKRILILLILLVVGTKAYAWYGLVYSGPDVLLDDETNDGYSLDFFSSPLGDWLLISGGIAEYQYSDFANKRVEIKAIHFPIYFVLGYSESDAFLVGLKNSYWYSVEREPKSYSDDGSTDYNAFQFFNGVSFRAVAAPAGSSDSVFVLETGATVFDYSAKNDPNDSHFIPMIGFGYYFK
jgi:hypothetical protein